MVMSFVPHALMAGFCSGAAIIIALSQMTNIMGYKVNKDNLQKGLGDLFGPNLSKAHGISVTMGKISQSHLHTQLGICINVSNSVSYYHIHLNTRCLFA